MIAKLLLCAATVLVILALVLWHHLARKRRDEPVTPPTTSVSVPDDRHLPETAIFPKEPPFLFRLHQAMTGNPNTAEVRVFNGGPTEADSRDWVEVDPANLISLTRGYRKFVCGGAISKKDRSVTHYFAFGPAVAALGDLYRNVAYKHQDVLNATAHYYVSEPSDIFPEMVDGGGVALFEDTQVEIGDVSGKFGASEALLKNTSSLELLSQMLGKPIKVVKYILREEM